MDNLVTSLATAQPARTAAEEAVVEEVAEEVAEVNEAEEVETCESAGFCSRSASAAMHL